MGWPQKVAGIPDMLVVVNACLEGWMCCSAQIVLDQDVTMQAGKKYRARFEALASEVGFRKGKGRRGDL